MESVIVGLVVLAFVGYGLYKIFVKKETVAEAATEIKNEVVAEAKKVEEVVVPVVTAEVAKIVEEAKVIETKVESAVVAEAIKVEEVVVAEVKKAKARVKKTAEKVVAVEKVVAAKVAKPRTKKTKV